MSSATLTTLFRRFLSFLSMASTCSLISSSLRSIIKRLCFSFFSNTSSSELELDCPRRPSLNRRGRCFFAAKEDTFLTPPTIFFPADHFSGFISSVTGAAEGGEGYTAVG